MDFRDGKWPAHLLFDGYILSVALILCVFFFHFVPPGYRYWPAFITASVVAIVQLSRLVIVFFPHFTAPGHEDPVNAPYFYAYVLAHRRVDSVEMPEGETQDLKWRDEIVETYRHLREHGNSAFIFLLELVLAALAYCVITKPGQSPTHQLGAVGLLFAIWAFPSAFVHLVAQHLERRFSRYDLRVRTVAGPRP
jgi:hypothetical protein